jgi:methyltransferase-like protein
MRDYCAEQKILQQRVAELEAKLKVDNRCEKGVLLLKEYAKNFLDDFELTKEIANQLIERVEIGRTTKNERDERVQEIKIVYRFVGDLFAENLQAA